MSQIERELLTLPISASAFDIAIILPDKYDDRAVSFAPPSLTKEDEKTYFLTANTITQQKVSSAWIVFPSPLRSRLNTAQLIFSLLLGVFTLVIHFKAFRDRKVSWSIGVLVLSLILLAVASYYTFALAKGVEFLTFASAAVPHAIYGFGASIYLIIARKYQATIGGQITIEDKPAEFAEVSLLRVDGENKNQIAKLDALKTGGRYKFYVWQKRSTSRYLVRARATGAKEGESLEIEVSKTSRREVPGINLEWLPQLSKSRGTEGEMVTSLK